MDGLKHRAKLSSIKGFLVHVISVYTKVIMSVVIVLQVFYTKREKHAQGRQNICSLNAKRFRIYVTTNTRETI